jgi:phosphatidylglycerophosphate synthase
MLRVQIRPGGHSANPANPANPANSANAVTTARLLLVGVVAALVVQGFVEPARTWLVVGVATAALVLDAVDGWVARQTGSCTRFGARYDLEADAFLMLALSVHVAHTLAWWVLLIGLARYLLLVAGWCWPWLRGETPPRYWAKVVAAIQGIVLTVVTADLLPRGLALTTLAVALGLLVESFGHQVRQLWRARPATTRAPSAAVTVAAYALVWLALVAPDRMSELSPAGLLQLPVELLALVVLAVVLPAPVRRPVAAALGVVLALLVVVRALDLGFDAVLDRRFDLLNDSYYLGPAIGVLRDSSGAPAAVGAVIAAVVLLALLVLLLTMAVVRAAAAAARHRRVVLPAVAGLAVATMLSAAAGGGIASTQTSALAARQVSTIGTDLADRQVFAEQIATDADLPTGLLSGLRGKDVLLVFVESYGRVAVQGTSYSAGVDAVLDRGTEQLRDAGFDSRSGFLTSPTFGAASWLAHSTLQSGLWVDSQQRYDQLVTSRRTTLTSAFEQAGWRTVVDVPANTKDWADGRRFYGFDTLYDARNVGYRGPRFSYATMPDQFTLAALERNELTPGPGQGGRRPVMAEIDLVSSHHPWTPLPPLVDWSSVGDGSVFDDVPAIGASPDEVFRDPDRVRAAYGRSIEYSWSTLVSWLVRRPDPNLVLVVLGDHQPHSYVSGADPGHDVPVSVIAQDPAVLASISDWGWTAGLRPPPDAPVSRMDTFRDRFLSAYSKPTHEGSTP